MHSFRCSQRLRSRCSAPQVVKRMRFAGTNALVTRKPVAQAPLQVAQAELVVAPAAALAAMVAAASSVV